MIKVVKEIFTWSSFSPADYTVEAFRISIKNRSSRVPARRSNVPAFPAHPRRAFRETGSGFEVEDVYLFHCLAALPASLTRDSTDERAGRLVRLDLVALSLSRAETG